MTTSKKSKAKKTRSKGPSRKPGVERILTKLIVRVHKLEEVSDTNAKVFSDAIQMAEVLIEVQQRIIDLQHVELCRLTGREVTPIDWAKQVQEYLAELAAKEEAVEETGPGLIASPDDTSDVIFGG